MEQNTKTCPFCAETIQAGAVKCRHCGEIIDPVLKTTNQQQQPVQQERKWVPGIAAVLSLIIPGAGQMYKGQIGTGIFWLIITTLGYCFFIIPGIILHLVCIVSAASGNPYR